MIVRLGLTAAATLLWTAAHAQSFAPPPQLVPMPPGLQLPPLAAPGNRPSQPPPVTAPAAPGPGSLPTTPPPSWEARQTADVQALDKVNDQTVNLAIPVGQTGQFGHLNIAVRACVVRPPDQPADAAAWLDIADPRPSAPGFHGWMLADEPAASMFEHPVYDVRLTGCH